MSGGNVTVVLNGIGPNEMAQLSVADVTTETIKRTAAWFVHATTLLGAVSASARRGAVLRARGPHGSPGEAARPGAVVIVKIHGVG